jgi:pyridoxal 5'-phosphate synthase pdxS subunit
MMLTGSDGVFVGSGIFKSQDPEARAKAIVEAVNHYDEPEVIAEVSRGIGEPMRGMEIEQLHGEQRLQERGW